MAATGTIRLARDDDAPALAAIYAPHVAASAVSFETEVPSPDEMRRRIAEIQQTHAWLVYVEHGTVGGYAYASKHRARAAYQWSVETSAYIGESFRRRHIAQALYTSLFGILVEQGFVNAYAGITLPNAASVAMHESAGFEPIGVYPRIGYKFGAWHDVGWWRLALQPHPAAPVPLRSLTDLTALPQFDRLLSAGLPLIRPVDAAV